MKIEMLKHAGDRKKGDVCEVGDALAHHYVEVAKVARYQKRRAKPKTSPVRGDAEAAPAQK